MISKSILRLEQLPGKSGPYKFVRFQNGDFYFVAIEPHCISHREMSEELRELGSPVAAGAIMLFKAQWYADQLESFSLGIKCSSLDLRDLSKALESFGLKEVVKRIDLLSEMN